MKKIFKIAKFIGLGVSFLVASIALAAWYPVEGPQFSISTAITSASTNTITLASFATPDGSHKYTMADFGYKGYGTLDANNNARAENIEFTGVTQNSDGSATLTGVVRGIPFSYPFAASSTIAKTHLVGASLILSNTADYYWNEFSLWNGNNGIWPTASSSPSTKGYVDYVAFNGAAVINGDTLNRGVVQLATGAQAAASTDTGSTGAHLVIGSSLATSTYNSATAANRVVTTQNSGFVDPNFISTLATSTTVGTTPIYQLGLQQQISTTTGTSTFSVPSGVTLIHVIVQAGGGNGANVTSANSTSVNAGGGGGGGGTCVKNVNVTGTSTIQFYVGAAGQWSTFGTNGFYCSANPGSNGLGVSTNYSGGVGGTASGGDLNITGGDGGSGGNINSTNIGGTNSFGIPGGQGGASYLGGGPAGGYDANGNNASNLGTGGGGASSFNGGVFTGGTGKSGAVIIQW